MSESTPPSWWYLNEKPKNDAAYFENLTRCIFQAGLNWQVITNKWPNFRMAFQNFDISKISSYDDKEVKGLMVNTGIIRNKRKIVATIFNAKEFEKLAHEHGSFQQWLKRLDKANNYAIVVKQLIQRFRHVGTMTTHTFLHSVGEAIEYDETVFGRHP